MKNHYKLLFSVIILLLVGFLSTSFYSYKMAIDATNNELKNKSLPLSSDNVYSEVQRDLLKPNLVSSLMAQDTFMIEWVLSGEKDTNEIEKYLAAIKERYKTSSSFFVSDLTNNYYYPKGILKKVSASNDRDAWFYRVKYIANEYETNIDPDLASNDSLTIFTNYKVRDSEGRFLGATGVGLKTKQVTDLLLTYKKKYGHDIYFVNRDNKVILTSQPTKLTKNSEFFKGIINEFNKYDKTTIERNYFNEKLIFNIRYIDELSLYLFVEAQESTLIKDFTNNFYLNIAIFSIIIIIIMSLIIANINYFQKKLERFAKLDRMTSLSNRNDFEVKFTNIYNSTRKHEKNICMLLVDIDSFKFINDELGHFVGDKILVLVSKIINKSFRDSDIKARWGGDEFIILLLDTRLKAAYSLAEKLRIAISKDKEIQEILKRELTVSIGVVENKKTESQDDFFIRVDKNMYEAKRAGKNITVT